MEAEEYVPITFALAEDFMSVSELFKMLKHFFFVV